MVTYVLWSPVVGRVPARVAHSAASPPPPHTSCGAARDLLLHHHRLVKLASGEAALLVDIGGRHRGAHGLQAPRRRHEVGSEAFLGPVVSLILFYRQLVLNYI